MSTPNEFLQELTKESVITRKTLERVPADKDDWRPHEKSRTIKELATHIAELPFYIIMALTTDEFDLQANANEPPVINNNEDLLNMFDNAIAAAKAQLEAANEKDLLPTWSLKNGGEVQISLSRGGLLRYALNEMIHHRAQLGVYFRLLDIPVPRTYGPTADEPGYL
ncbi:DinB family protein [Pedobacter hartonius]|uniref:Uncharacterized damage-inducible protein DinB (Forms a four-helix bundle) n=1 Tax=Pedobacter hartonius TaxID=425514 RepID=A0A1H4AJR8_9SPHI|nr:DinB family protein [Pedobacter hartonius]SEA36213.1 Uncharacterized damage-inducible protein DinB (forms a four-helix bundle) [Pedobacter hartonius]